MYVGCDGGGGGGDGAYGVAIVGVMVSPHEDGAPLDLAIIAIFCCVAAIAALNSAILSLLCCNMYLLDMIKSANPSRMVSRILPPFSSAAFLA